MGRLGRGRKEGSGRRMGGGRSPALRAGADGEEKHGLVFLSGGPVLVQDGSFFGLWSLLTHKHIWECVGVWITPFLLEVLRPEWGSGYCLPSQGPDLGV